MKKAEYKILVSTNKKTYAEDVSGYPFEVETDCKKFTLAARKVSSIWVIDELETGKAVWGRKHRTRKAAVDYATNGEGPRLLVAWLNESNHADKFEAWTRAFDVIKEKPMHPKKYDALVQKFMGEIAAERRAKEAEAAAETTTVVTVETMREWAKDKGLRVEQAGRTPERRAMNPIWVLGVKLEDKAYQEELKALGFKWGRSREFGKGWHHELANA